MSIPVFHDDQHGTAIISSAALLNACEITGRTMAELRIVVNGAGAAAMACARMYDSMGVSRENILLVDSRGVIYKGRAEGMNPYKEKFALETRRRTLTDAVRGANVLVGLSVKGAFSPEILGLMADNPIIFPLANPDPEIGYEEARAARPDAIRPVLRVIPRREGVKNVSGVYLMVFKNQSLFFGDPTVNITPSSEDLAEIAILTGKMADFFDMVPRVAMLSFSDFGTSMHPDAQRVKAAVSIARERAPELMIDGEMQADTAVVGEILARAYPFSRLNGPANVLIFPELAAANVAYKLLSRLGGAKAVGPLLMGVSKPFNVLHRGSDMENVVHVIAITVAQAQELEG